MEPTRWEKPDECVIKIEKYFSDSEEKIQKFMDMATKNGALRIEIDTGTLPKDVRAVATLLQNIREKRGKSWQNITVEPKIKEPVELAIKCLDRACWLAGATTIVAQGTPVSYVTPHQFIGYHAQFVASGYHEKSGVPGSHIPVELRLKCPLGTELGSELPYFNTKNMPNAVLVHENIGKLKLDHIPSVSLHRHMPDSMDEQATDYVPTADDLQILLADGGTTREESNIYYQVEFALETLSRHVPDPVEGARKESSPSSPESLSPAIKPESPPLPIARPMARRMVPSLQSFPRALSPQLSDSNDLTPLMRAALQGNDTIIRELLEAGADPTVDDYRAIRLAAERSKGKFDLAILNFYVYGDINLKTIRTILSETTSKPMEIAEQPRVAPDHEQESADEVSYRGPGAP